jgi:polyisoprenoid-binding protein YceI
VVPGANSFVGYRVNETLGGVGATTAVGRTQSVQGSLTIDGNQITRVEINANVATLQSDKSMRDNAIKNQALESNDFPTATFALASAIDIAGVPQEGESITKSVEGDFTLHGVTRRIQLEVQGVLQGGQLVLVSSTEIKFADFGIEQPRAAAVLSVEDRGIMEFQLVFAKSA